MVYLIEAVLMEALVELDEGVHIAGCGEVVFTFFVIFFAGLQGDAGDE